VRWFSKFPPLNEKKDQTTSGSYQNATEPNQSTQHPYPFSSLMAFVRSVLVEGQIVKCGVA
jgi:hypothetical protein